MQTEQQREKILVVEDDAATREGLAFILGRAGYEAATAPDGREALALLGSGPLPALILLDMFMPGMDGWGFLDRLRLQAPARPVPIVIATAAAILTREWAIDHSCSGFLRKPFEADELLDEVRRCLGG
jgi:CheY-like chemotaxis protein